VRPAPRRSTDGGSVDRARPSKERPMSATDENDFDIVAPIYDAIASFFFAGTIKQSQIDLLPRLKDIDSALIVGGGTGWFLLELLERTAVKRVVYVELSESMLAKSRRLIERKRPEWLHRVDFRLGTEAALTPADGSFSLIATCFFLSCFNDENAAGMIERLHPWLAPDGHWLNVDFQFPEGGLPRLTAHAVFKVMFTFFNVFSNLEAKRPPLSHIGFDRVGLHTRVERTFYARMIRAKLLSH
jgi:tRNA (cmo5U34)-methyltransferase